MIRSLIAALLLVSIFAGAAQADPCKPNRGLDSAAPCTKPMM